MISVRALDEANMRSLHCILKGILKIGFVRQDTPFVPIISLIFWGNTRAKWLDRCGVKIVGVT
jgi:hypothetical protein